MNYNTPYASDIEAVIPPVIEEPCKHAPSTGIHLYHFPMSLCSQKIRQVLEEKQVNWTSHVILLKSYEQYEPRYVRMNPRCVVPLLVQDGKITTDSENILRHVASTFEGGSRLIPQDSEEVECMEHFVEMADEVYMEPQTYGDVPGVKKPFLIRFFTKGDHLVKIKLLTKLIHEHQDDPFLKLAYERKLTLVKATNDMVTSPANLLRIVESCDKKVELLEQQLANGPFSQGGWLCSKSFSVADIEWGVVLYRFHMLNLGEKYWGARPNTARYAMKLFERPSFQKTIIKGSNILTETVPLLLKHKIKNLFRPQRFQSG